jgi:hypothetical protein
MFVNLTQYGVKRMINSANVSFDLDEVDQLAIRVNDLVETYRLRFKDKREMDGFLGIFTGSLNNL